MAMDKVEAEARTREQLGGSTLLHEALSPAQLELLRDMRESLRQMKRGESLPARETLREIELELEAEDDANHSNA